MTESFYPFFFYMLSQKFPIFVFGNLEIKKSRKEAKNTVDEDKSDKSNKTKRARMPLKPPVIYGSAFSTPLRFCFFPVSPPPDVRMYLSYFENKIMIKKYICIVKNAKLKTAVCPNNDHTFNVPISTYS